MDEHTRECLAIRDEMNIKSSNIIETLADLMVVRGVPEHICSDIVLTAMPKEYAEAVAALY